ncbi:MAG: hypothetical protein M3220_06870 [Chloroflexota bacterium]|nr:hypothetical protein [Chloroflexota bacterium]
MELDPERVELNKDGQLLVRVDWNEETRGELFELVLRYVELPVEELGVTQAEKWISTTSATIVVTQGETQPVAAELWVPVQVGISEDDELFIEGVPTGTEIPPEIENQLSRLGVSSLEACWSYGVLHLLVNDRQVLPSVGLQPQLLRRIVADEALREVAGVTAEIQVPVVLTTQVDTLVDQPARSCAIVAESNTPWLTVNQPISFNVGVQSVDGLLVNSDHLTLQVNTGGEVTMHEGTTELGAVYFTPHVLLDSVELGINALPRYQQVGLWVIDKLYPWARYNLLWTAWVLYHVPVEFPVLIY